MTLQVQIRRGTAAAVGAITPVEGEMIYSTDTKRMSIGDGSTTSGNWVGGPLKNLEVLKATDNAGTGTVDILRVNASDGIDVLGDVNFADDKVLALEASGAGSTTLATFTNSVGLNAELITASDAFLIKLGQAGGAFQLRDSSNVVALTVEDNGIITGPSSVPTSITTGAANGLVIGQYGDISISKASTSARDHHLFYNPNGLIASLQTASDYFAINAAQGNIELQTPGVTVLLDTTNIAFRPSSAYDNAIDLGRASQRWATVYAGTGTINTSDETEKDLDVLEAEENEKVLDAVEATPIMNYQLKDAVEAKSADKARIHYGTGAQTLKANLEAQGLDPFKYAVLCFDEWEEEVEDVFETQIQLNDDSWTLFYSDTDYAKGDIDAKLDNNGDVITREVKVGTKVILEAGSRYGVRYGEFYALKIACLERKLATL